MEPENREGQLVTVYVTYGMLRANVIHGLLKSAGIPSMLSYEAAGPAIGVMIDGLGKVEVKVPAVWAKEARELLAADPAPDDDLPPETTV